MLKRKLVILTVILSAASVILSSQLVIPVRATEGGKSLIAFESNRTGVYQIYVMNPDGSGVSQLTDTEKNNRTPRWSPDAQQIAFTASTDDGSQIFIMNADGSNRRQLMKGALPNNFPSWSPDGKQIVFSTVTEKNGQTKYALAVVGLDGKNIKVLMESDAFLKCATFSPDGKSIAYISDDESKLMTDLYVMESDGTQPTKLVSGRILLLGIAWSPDGEQLTFSVFDSDHGDIYLINRDGSNLHRLSNAKAPSANQFPSWSPDGKSIAFSGGGRNDSNLFVINTDGTGFTQLTQSPKAGEATVGNNAPDWSSNFATLDLPLASETATP